MCVCVCVADWSVGPSPGLDQQKLLSRFSGSLCMVWVHSSHRSLKERHAASSHTTAAGSLYRMDTHTQLDLLLMKLSWLQNLQADRLKSARNQA